MATCHFSCFGFAAGTTVLRLNLVHMKVRVAMIREGGVGVFQIELIDSNDIRTLQHNSN